MTYERQHEVSEELLRMGLQNEYGICKDEVLRNASGKPSLFINRHIHISISHCTHGVTVILSKNRVGIDIEPVRSFDPYAAKRILGEEELKDLYESPDRNKTFFRYFTLKESYIKALGCGFSYPVKSLKLSILNDQVTSNLPLAVFHLLEGNTGYITSVCHLRQAQNLEEDLREIKITIP